MSKRIDIQNKKFDSLKVISSVGNKNTHAIWNVQCECGRIFQTTYVNLKSGNITRCKCCGQTTHGLTDTKYYRKYLTIRARHGKDGLCTKWQTFNGFMEDTFKNYQNGYRLFRKNNNIPFCKENCCWIAPRNGNQKSKRIEF